MAGHYSETHRLNRKLMSILEVEMIQPMLYKGHLEMVPIPRVLSATVRVRIWLIKNLL